MTAITRSFGSVTTIAATNAYSGGDADLAADSAYDICSTAIDLSSNEGAAITIDYDSAGTTDNLTVGIFPSIDNSNFDDNPALELEINATSGSAEQYTFIVEKYPYFKVGVKSGSTDTFDYKISYRAWAWASA